MSLFWQLRTACINGSKSGIITAFDPPPRAQYAKGREAWQALVGKVNTKLQLDCQATVWNRKLLDLVFTHKSSTTMASHCNDFNSCISKLDKLNRQDYSKKRLYTLFTESILDSTFNNTLKEGEKNRWTSDKLQDELCYDEQINT